MNRPCQRVLTSNRVKRLMNQSNPTKRFSNQAHYEAHSSDSYQQAFFYSEGDYMDHLGRVVLDKLRLDSSSLLLDLGGGTGNFTSFVLDQVEGARGVVVDPFLETAQLDQGADKISFVSADAESFAQATSGDGSADSYKSGYSHILLKEVVHHLENRTDIFRGLLNGLQLPVGDRNDGYPLLIMTRPQKNVDYPLWDGAREVWADNQPSAELLVDELQQAGFVDTEITEATYPCKVQLSAWQKMVKNRFWSTFSNFSDEELEMACEDIAKNYKDRISDAGIIHFNDQIVCICARAK